MSRLLKFDVFEKVQSEWLDKNKDFYLTKNEKDRDKNKDKNKKISTISKIINDKLKKLNIDDIKFYHNKSLERYAIKSPVFLKNSFLQLWTESPLKLDVDFRTKSDYNYKIILSFIKYMKDKDITFTSVEKDVINPLFTELNNYFGLFYDSDIGYCLFVTTSSEAYKEKISKIKQDPHNKIIYYNNKTKGKEFTDIELVEINKIRNKLKNINFDDIVFKLINGYDRLSYSVEFKDRKLTDDVYKYQLISPMFFNRDSIYSGKIYFGHLKNRYHVNNGLNDRVKGISLGYKIYKAFLKFNGYMVSDQQTSMEARNIYLNLLKDDDVYYIIDKKPKNKGTTYGNDSSKIMIIWKDYPKIEQLLRIVRTHELRNKLHYDYDKSLLKYIENITKETVNESYYEL